MKAIIVVMLGETFLITAGILGIFFPEFLYQLYCDNFLKHKISSEINPFGRYIVENKSHAIAANRLGGVVMLIAAMVLLILVFEGWRTGNFPLKDLQHYPTAGR